MSSNVRITGSISALLIVLGVAESRVSADTTCHGAMLNDPTMFFCEDFDRYCGSPPADPTMPCVAPTGGKNDVPLHNTWDPMDYLNEGQGVIEQCPGDNLTVEDDSTRLVSPLYGGRYPCQAPSHQGQNQVDLVNEIQGKFGAQYTKVVGTDSAPLVLAFEMNAGNCGTVGNCNFHGNFDIGYMELGLDAQYGAPMDFIKVGSDDGTGTCIDCWHMCPGPNFSVHVAWPTVCQSYAARTLSPSCPPAMTDVRSAMAVGINKLLDNNPCHCETPNDQVPNVGRLAFYDGLKWRIIGQNEAAPPDEVPPATYVHDATHTADFELGHKFNFVTLTIKTNTVDIEMTTKTLATTNVDTPTVNSKVTGISRKYLGGFNKLRAGVRHGCQLKNGVYQCVAASGPGHDTCFRIGDTRCDNGQFQDDKSANIAFDNVFMKGGGPDVQTGACCLPNATCTVTTQSDCEVTQGGKFAGLLSACASTVCCHVPFADADGDHDVDMGDYAAFQNCYNTDGTNTPHGSVTGACKCFDKASPVGNIDADDFTQFTNCVTGPNVNGPSANVPWLQANTPSCSKCPPPPALAPGCP